MEKKGIGSILRKIVLKIGRSAWLDLSKVIFFAGMACLSLTHCYGPKLPKSRVNQYRYFVSKEFRGDSTFLRIENPLHSPLRFWITLKDSLDEDLIKHPNPILLASMEDTSLFISDRTREIPLWIESKLGDPGRIVKVETVSLPFPAGYSQLVIQGHNSRPTHNTPWSRYAVDFDLKKGDTVCAALDGYVVGVVEAFRFGGEGPEWKPFGNFITLYHPQNGLYTQYVHLDYEGSLVQVGDTVSSGDAIGLAGFTGQTNIQHLHFNALVPDSSEDGMRSIPVDFSQGYRGASLQRGDTVIRLR